MNVPMFGQCPICRHGSIFAASTRGGHTVVMCDEDDALWLHPRDIPNTAAAQAPRYPDYVIRTSDGSVVGLGEEPRTYEDIVELGWDPYVVAVYDRTPNEPDRIVWDRRDGDVPPPI